MNRIIDGYDFIQRHSWDTLAQLPEMSGPSLLRIQAERDLLSGFPVRCCNLIT